MKDKQLRQVLSRLAANQPVRRSLPFWGRLHIDRQVPFLCLYRRPPDRPDPWADRLVVGEASYLKADGAAEFHSELSEWVMSVAETLSREFGSFLIVEIWTGPDSAETAAKKAGARKPVFRIVSSRKGSTSSVVAELTSELARIRALKQPAGVVSESSGRIAPPGLAPILTRAQLKRVNGSLLGLEVRPVFRDKDTLFPLERRILHRGISLALKQAFFRFAEDETTHRPAHYHCLGRRAVVKAVWEADRGLAEIVHAFDFLLLVTPVNSDAAWKRFRRGGYDQAPRFQYRPIPVSPAALKRSLFRVPIHKVEDPTLADLFEEKRRELDRKITLLEDRGTDRFVFGGFQLYGRVDAATLTLAREILARFPEAGRGEKRCARVTAEAFVRRARAEIEFYRRDHPSLKAKVKLRHDVPGLMVSRGTLLVGTGAHIAASRVEALLQHEIGVHLLSHHNGKLQPFKLIRYGLPGYEETEEGLAVLAEFLASGLSVSRLRVLAARVVATQSLAEGAGFIDTFRELRRDYNFGARTAFTIAMRTHRGGGLPKDAVYLGGLSRILAFLQKGGDLDALLIGRVSIRHAPVIEELRWRELLNPAIIRPRFLTEPDSAARLRPGGTPLTVHQLIGTALP